MSGFADASDATLEQTRRSLHEGLRRVLDAHTAGTLDQCGPRGAASARQAGFTTLILLEGVEAEQRRRVQYGCSPPIS